MNEFLLILDYLTHPDGNSGNPEPSAGNKMKLNLIMGL
jgi:hypothetical protein